MGPELSIVGGVMLVHYNLTYFEPLNKIFLIIIK